MPASDIRIDLIFNDFQIIGQRAERKALEISERTAFSVLRRAIQKIQQGPHTGRVYKRGKKAHQASAPGEPPATDTDFLAASGGVKKIAQALYEVFFLASYALALEFGTAIMAARPFLRPSVEEEREGFIEAMKGIFR